MLVVVVVFPHWRFFIFRLLFVAISTPHWLHRPVKASTSSELYLDYFWYFICFCQAFLSLVCLILPWVLWFWVSVFDPQAFLSRTPFPHLGAFVTEMKAGTPHPGFCSMSALIKLFLLTSACSWTTHIPVTKLLFT